jgi:lipopolysaccharide/colanic/teichoic acid biosynthesis glycosyltransferase
MASTGGTTVDLTSNRDHRHGMPTLMEATPPRYFARKAWPMRILGTLLLCLASPLILLLIMLVRLTSAGPGLYRQIRTGRHGATFMMYKLRTMYNDAESVSGPIWCKPGDSRITPLGKLLRLLHLDELPQLINVARGEMDLIGPRPERPVFVANLEREIPNYGARLQVLPGVTGLAQINLPPDETIDCVRKKLQLDCAYIREAGFAFDLRILICTSLRMIGIRHGRAALWLGVKRQVDVGPPQGHHRLLALPSWADTVSARVAPHANGHESRLALVTIGAESAESLGGSNGDSSAGAPFDQRLPR